MKYFLFLLPVFLLTGCATGPVYIELNRSALPPAGTEEQAFFEKLAPSGKISARQVETIHLCFWQRSATERVWMLWTDAKAERVPLTSDGSIYAVYDATGKKARLEAGGGAVSYADLTSKPLYIIGSGKLTLDVPLEK